MLGGPNAHACAGLFVLSGSVEPVTPHGNVSKASYCLEGLGAYTKENHENTITRLIHQGRFGLSLAAKMDHDILNNSTSASIGTTAPSTMARSTTLPT